MIAALLTGCGAISGLIRSVSDGCQFGEPSLNADASHSNSRAMQIIQYDKPVTSTVAGAGMRSGGRRKAMKASTAPASRTQIRALALNGALPPAIQA